MTDERSFTVVVCTRGRPRQLALTLDALRAGTVTDFPLLVVDQSEARDEELERRASVDPLLDVVRDGGRGLSRARNLALARAQTEWLAFVDDDCLVEHDWAAQLQATLRTHPSVALVAGDVAETGAPAGDYVENAELRVERERTFSRRFVHPGLVALGVCFTVKRVVAERLGGWDERLGIGTDAFPAGEDLDFVYRLLRAGEVAFQTPAIRARHLQWRRPDELPALYRGYLVGFTGFALKHLRRGDLTGGARLWLIGAVDFLDALASAVAHRSRFRLRIALAKLAGLFEGTAKGIATRW